MSSFFIVKDENGNDTQDKFNLARSFVEYLDHSQKQSAMKYVIDERFAFIFCLNLLYSNLQNCGIPHFFILGCFLLLFWMIESNR